MKLNRYRDELPFGDDELREIRSSVMKQVEEEQRAPRWLGIFVRATLVAAVLVLLVVRPMHETSVRLPEKATPVAVKSEPRLAVTEPPVIPIERPRRTSRRPKRIERIAPPPGSQESDPAPVRIELQTSNPNIRILWISQPSGETR